MTPVFALCRAVCREQLGWLLQRLRHLEAADVTGCPLAAVDLAFLERSFPLVDIACRKGLLPLPGVAGCQFAHAPAPGGE